LYFSSLSSTCSCMMFNCVYHVHHDECGEKTHTYPLRREALYKCFRVLRNLWTNKSKSELYFPQTLTCTPYNKLVSSSSNLKCRSVSCSEMWSCKKRLFTYK
jgi:hypothetical protein